MNISERNYTSVQPPPGAAVLFIIPGAINFIISLPTNAYTLWLIVNGPAGTKASELFALNMAVSEILNCLCSILAIVNSRIQIAALNLLVTFSFCFMNTGRPLFQCCISMERYLAVVHPVIFLKYKPLRYRLGCCGAVWLLVVGSGLISMLLNGAFIYNFVYLAQCIILLCVMMFCCLAVLKALKRPGPGDGDREGTNKTKSKAFRTILIIQVSMLVNYIPLILITSSSFLLNPMTQNISNTIGFSISTVTGVVQPLLYLHRVGKLPRIRAC
ncbi:hypothetical protein DPEC_G00015550 [Dallia pectoralis]|uniref:Uncharacterized protein n=1 Tax=Dallia pectoralis TaxID=75939 RepID=A0ACC2HMU8_DALPE|nr:hypothetical protein DPEC_G00015550 [Dallia pectoralis]